MREAVVASVSGYPVPADGGRWHPSLVDKVWRYWEGRLATVAPSRPDLIVLPELFDRPIVSWSPFEPLPLDDRREFALHKGSEMRDRIAELASRMSTAITYPSYRVDQGRIFNSVEVIRRDGSSVGFADKLAPTPGEASGIGVRAGDSLLTFDLGFGTVTAVVCFDLNFPEVHALLKEAAPRLILFPSAYHGGLMQNFVAYNSRAFLAASVYPPNPSSMVNPLGVTIGESSNYDFSLSTTVNFDYEVVHLDFNQEKLVELKRRYGRDVAVTDPGRLGAVMISSCSGEVTAAEMVAEMQIERLDDYFERSTAHFR